MSLSVDFLAFACSYFRGKERGIIRLTHSDPWQDALKHKKRERRKNSHIKIEAHVDWPYMEYRGLQRDTLFGPPLWRRHAAAGGPLPPLPGRFSPRPPASAEGRRGRLSAGRGERSGAGGGGGDDSSPPARPALPPARSRLPPSPPPPPRQGWLLKAADVGADGHLWWGHGSRSVEEGDPRRSAAAVLASQLRHRATDSAEAARQSVAQAEVRAGDHRAINCARGGGRINENEAIKGFV